VAGQPATGADPGPDLPRRGGAPRRRRHVRPQHPHPYPMRKRAERSTRIRSLVWPGSHRALARRYLSDPVQYEWMEALAACHGEVAEEEGVVAVELLPVAGDVVSLLASSRPLLPCLSQCRHFQGHCSLCAPAPAALAYLPIPMPPLPRPLHHVMYSLFCPAAALPGLSLRPQRQRKHERCAAADVPEPLRDPVDAEGDQGRRKRLVNNEPQVQACTCGSIYSTSTFHHHLKVV